MSVLAIARMGHPSLRTVARVVEDPTSPEIARLAADMIDTMRAAPGVGLAAPQVHAPVRLIVVRAPADRTGGEPLPEMALINPEITPLDGSSDPESVLGWEGCLSVPGQRGLVPRLRRIGLKALTLDGTTIEREYADFAARVIQHETDHLDGLLYIQRMNDLSLLAFDDQAHHLAIPLAPRDVAPTRESE